MTCRVANQPTPTLCSTCDTHHGRAARVAGAARDRFPATPFSLGPRKPSSRWNWHKREARAASSSEKARTAGPHPGSGSTPSGYQKLLRGLRRRAADAHKGDFGRVLVVGGSIGMVGAPALAANAALRTGAGLVKIAAPEPAQQAIATLAPCATSVPVAGDRAGRIAPAALPTIRELAEAHDVLAVGPGAGTSKGWQRILSALLALPGKPMVIDADGLNNLAEIPRWWQRLRARVVLTPHPGEMKRLLVGGGFEARIDDRQATAREFARLTGCVVVLKGHHTVIADAKRAEINATGNPGMATAGSGDVLTGIIAGLLGQGVGLFEAAWLGAWLHGRAGDLAAKRQGQVSVIATDILDELPNAMRQVPS